MVSDSLGIQFEIVFKKLSEREKTNSFLSRHFMLSDQSNVDLIPSVTRKVECVFQKSGDVKKHYAAAVVFDENENVLLCKRAAYKKIAPNMWHLPGGAIEEGENPIEAITRELKEELDLDTVTVIPTKTTLTYPIEGGFMQTHCFYVDVSNDPTILNEENSEFQFVKPDAVSEYIEEHLLDDNMKAIRAAFKAAQSQ
jgi:8-oxo-dGTP diphosphatase